MKKQFFYAAMALAVMSSCSNDNDPGVVPNPDEGNNDKVAIELGVSNPSVTVNTRGHGSVGDVEGVNNHWSSQQLFIYMIDKATGIEAEDPVGTKILDNTPTTGLKFYAPKDGSSTDIRIYKDYTAEQNNGVIQYKYYPANGTYKFYGYHLDDAIIDAGQPTITADPTSKATSMMVNGITIDGTQDILGAATIALPTEQNTANADAPYYIANAISEWAKLVSDYQFSARTARNKIKPILKFEHQLARLQFYIRAGNETAAELEYDATTSLWKERESTDTQPVSLGMQVTRITLNEMVNKINMNLTNVDATTQAEKPVSTKVDENTASFYIHQKNPTTGELEVNTIEGDTKNDLTESVSPKYPWNHANKPTEESDIDATLGTKVGEPILFFPNGDIKFTINLKQYLIDTENETDNSFTYDWKTNSADLTLYEKAIAKAEASGSLKFEPGKSYNVYLTIYGFERIEITAELTAWEEGGDITTDIEDNKEPEVTPVP